MNVTKEQQKTEAIRRMEKLNLYPQTIKEFKRKNVLLNFSEGDGYMGGALYWITEENYLNDVKEFEEETNNLVYHVIHNTTEFGELLSFLYVSPHDEEWEMDMDDINNGIALAYVKNLSCKEFSEYGYIGIRNSIGGLVRTA